MSDQQGDIIDQAIAWHLRLSTADEEQWLSFVEWLELSPAHAAAYDRIVDDEIMTAPALDLQQEGHASIRRVEQERRRWQRRGGWAVAAAGALAASIAGLVYLPQAPHPASGPRMIATAPGERRTVALADGTRIEMNGGTELQLASGDARQVRLSRGQAIFHVEHDPAHPFEVAMGDVTLRDVGTVFDVTREPGRLLVQVADGAVTYQPEGEALTLRKGMALASRDGDDRLVVTHIAADTVGGWRERRLTFRETPLRSVAAAIQRTTGASLTASDAVSTTPFTGSIRLVGDAEKDAQHLAALAGVAVRRDGAGWILISGSNAPD